MPADDRDKLFERALAQQLRRTPQGEACPDSEILAAYHERTLSLEESAHWKQHIAACSRCQETLALLEETGAVPENEWEEQEVALLAQGTTAAPTRASAVRGHAMEEPALPEFAGAPPTAARVLVRPKVSRWIVPLGALAAGLLVWVGLHETRRAEKQAAVEIAQNRQASPPPSPNTSRQFPAQQEQSNPSSRMPAPAMNLKREAPPPVAKLSSPAMNQLAGRLDAPQVPTNHSVEADKLVASEQKQSQELSSAKSAPAIPSPTAAADSSAVAQLPAAPSALPSAGAGAGGAIGGKQTEGARKKDLLPSTSQSVEVTGAVVATAPTAARSYSELEMSKRQSSSPASFVKNGGGAIIVASKTHSWRVGAGGKIELSTDGGKSSEQQASPVVTDLTAGSAPSEKVCWIIGKAGTVLLTTDGGKTWTLRNSPIPDDLGGIRADDASHATIWDLANQRRFATADGGATWSQISGK